MTEHWPVLVALDDPSGDLGSPSQFVTTVLERLGKDSVEDAFRTAGRFDAVVFLKKNPKRTAQQSVLEIMAIPGVRRVVPLPDRAHGHR